MTRYLFEEPWPLIVLLGCVAFALLLTGMRRRQRAWLAAAGVAAALAVGAYLLARAVTTDAETVEQRTRELVAATSPLDPPALRRFIHDSAVVSLPDGSMLPMSLALSDELADAVGRHAVTQQSISGLHAEPLGRDTIEARLSVRSTLREQDFHPIDTEWLLTWRRPGGGDEWRIVAVLWVEFEGRPPTLGLWR